MRCRYLMGDEDIETQRAYTGTDVLKGRLVMSKTLGAVAAKVRTLSLDRWLLRRLTRPVGDQSTGCVDVVLGTRAFHERDGRVNNFASSMCLYALLETLRTANITSIYLLKALSMRRQASGTRRERSNLSD